jgi:hypothetical protein
MTTLGEGMGYWAGRFLDYVAGGDDAFVLTPVAPTTGDPVPFACDQIARETEPTDAGAIVKEYLVAMTAELLPEAGQYTWKGHQWTVSKARPDYLAGTAMPHRMVLERHVG